MVSIFRIDFRLLHFQTAQVWPKKMGCDMIVIANDNVSKDSMRISLMKMSTPAGIKLKICPVDDAAQYLMSDKAKSRNIELLVDSPKDAYRIREKVEGLDDINVALLKGGEGKRMASPSLFFSEEDEEYLKKLAELKVNLLSYVTPDDRKVPVKNYL